MALPAVIEPCLPSPGEQAPTGPGWVHEIKHDGYRLMARREALSVGIRLLTKNGHGVSLPAHPPSCEATEGAQLGCPDCGKTANMRATTLVCVCDGETVRKVSARGQISHLMKPQLF